MKRFAAAASAALLVLTGTTGCIGGMAVTANVRSFNLEVTQNRWGREAVFLLLYLVPVYPFAAFADLLVVNSIEFHSGKNPVSGEPRVARAGESRREVAPDGTVSVSTLRADGSIDFAITAPDGTAYFVNLQDRGDRLVARDADGGELASVTR